MLRLGSKVVYRGEFFDSFETRIIGKAKSYFIIEAPKGWLIHEELLTEIEIVIFSKKFQLPKTFKEAFEKNVRAWVVKKEELEELK